MEARTHLEKCFDCIVDVFHKYSIIKKDYDMLNKGELGKLMREQLPNYLESTKDPKAVENLLKDLDKNKDQELSFEEVMVFFCRLIILTHDEFHDKHGHGPGHGHGHSH